MFHSSLQHRRSQTSYETQVLTLNKSVQQLEDLLRQSQVRPTKVEILYTSTPLWRIQSRRLSVFLSSGLSARTGRVRVHSLGGVFWARSSRQIS